MRLLVRPSSKPRSADPGANRPAAWRAVPRSPSERPRDPALTELCHDAVGRLARRREEQRCPLLCPNDLEKEKRPEALGLWPVNLWSGRLDLNQRPLGPEPSALPNCATSRIMPALAEPLGIPRARSRATRDCAPVPIATRLPHAPRHGYFSRTAPPNQPSRRRSTTNLRKPPVLPQLSSSRSSRCHTAQTHSCPSP